MLKFERRSIALLAVAACAATTTATYAHAETDAISDGILITGGLEPLPTKEVTSSYTIITAKDIEEHQYRTVTEALRAVPGIHAVQQGGQGTITSAFLRGANSNQTLVMINGQPVNDPSSPTNAFNFADLTTENVERIEIVRGPQSALYGSQAMGGVINIITKKGAAAPGGSLRLEAGTRGRFNAAGTSGGSFGSLSYFASLSRQYTHGTDITPGKYRSGVPRERDGYENITGSLRLDNRFGENLRGTLFTQFSDTDTDLDNFGEDVNYRGRTWQFTSNGSLSGSYFGGKVRPTLSASFMQIRRNDENPPDTYAPTTNVNTTYFGRRYTASIDTAIDLLEWNTLVVGAKWSRDELDSTGFSNSSWSSAVQNSHARENATAIYATENLNFGERVFALLSVRYDMPEKFDNQTTFTIAPGYYHPETDTRITLSYGTGFKTPSLYQRFGFTPDSLTSGAFTGNPNLSPERSQGWEVSVDQGLFAERVRVGVTYFMNRVKDPIITQYDTFYINSTSVNGPDFRSHGIESEVDAQILDNLSATLSYTFTVMEPGNTNATSRRPRHKLSFSANWAPDERTTVATDVNFVDVYADPGFYGGIVNPTPYTTIDVAVTRKLTDMISVSGKVSNLLDRTYYPADGYEAPGFEALAGVTVSF